jgi:hypothetical protein
MRRASRNLRDSQNFRFDSGTSKEGMFLRVVHLPTGKSRVVEAVGKRLRESHCTYDQLLSALMRELVEEAERHSAGESND